MAYWLLKTEPDAYSWDEQVKKGAKGDAWTGVRNFVARKNLQAMKKGDRAFFYHTGDEKQVVGAASVVSVDDSDAKNPRVKIKAGKAVLKPTTLAEIKTKALFKDSPLVRQSRLSVVPLTNAQYESLVGR